MKVLALIEYISDSDLAPAYQIVQELGGEILRPNMSLPAAERTAQGLEMMGQADAMLASRFGEEHLKRAEKLRWIHSPMAGVNHLLIPALVKSPIVLTNGAGMNAIPIAEHVFGLLLAFTRRLAVFHTLQKEARWQMQQEAEELYGRTLGIVGYGSIGREIARIAKGFGMQVWATKRNPGDPATAKDPHLDRTLPPAQLHQLLSQADFVVLSTALTPETENMIGAAELAVMKPTAYLINIARGQLIQEAALLEALQEGKIAGAGLDVVVQEPLPPDSPLWKAPNLLITAHSSWASPHVRGRNVQLFCDNLRRFAAGQPLLNIVDKELGY